jgi:putative flippase GtrA
MLPDLPINVRKIISRPVWGEGAIKQKSQDTVPAVVQIGRFGIVGVSNTLIDFGILNLLILWLRVSGGWPLLLCNAAGFAGASVNSYLLNRKWTFEEEGEATSGQYLFFLTFALGGLAINSLVLYLLTGLVPIGGAAHPILMVNAAKVIATGAGMTWNFLTFRFLVFRRNQRGLPREQMFSDGRV